MTAMGPISVTRAQWIARNVLPHEAALRGWLARKPGLPFEADDLIQETYAIFAGLASVDHIRNPRTYMYQTAYSLALQQMRRARIVSIQSVADIEALEAAADAPSPEDHAADRQELQRLADAIGALPRRCGEVFTLRKVEGLAQRDVAARLGLAESTVEKHLAKAIRLLADIFSRGGNPGAGASSLVTNDRASDDGRA